jgi:hypothetical protein
MQTAPNTEALDEHLRVVIQALNGAVSRAMPHVKDDPKTADQAIADCKEILDEVIDGNVSEWLK